VVVERPGTVFVDDDVLLVPAPLDDRFETHSSSGSSVFSIRAIRNSLASCTPVIDVERTNAVASLGTTKGSFARTGSPLVTMFT